MHNAQFAVMSPVHLGLHLMGLGDITLPVQARYDGNAYLAEFDFDETALNALFHGRPGQRYDAITVYDQSGRRIDLLPLPKPRPIFAGDKTRARVEMDPIYHEEPEK